MNTITKFKIESERYSIFDIILVIVALLLIIFSNIFLLKFVSFIIIIQIGYNYYKLKTVLTIIHQNLIIETNCNDHLFPSWKLKKYSFTVSNITKIIITQTHNGMYDRKTINVFEKNDNSTEIILGFRYYQLVTIQNYFNKNLKIETILMG